ncbi:MAG: Rpp14/Pop5 family protein [Methanothrix sp.]|uniref:Ribonuclease P protein component 2 n=1 Tax=Methanothrix harundinacea TaxID=301375 RepID=A0A101FUD1_9EURY|nr:MAG: ribonuclease P [Methanosaeta sp. SDB]KUK44556.1 MAG: Ribonuclease P protein component 2 [Methanothrix harundinacea]MDD2639092.1 Rpp14/Pop5 family protein [Methanothrix sp.]MDI9400141.1 Rpp14/Pop5 family protein [Euryarchaeota archaeon]KUK96634.1 MAG: Ribonuclease P protein component 2 [Methanothrix harundinacea]
MRSWLPVLRDRRRYIAFELEAEGRVSRGELVGEIRAAQSSLFGDLGAAKNRFRMISFDGRFGLIRCSHKRTEECRALLATVGSVAGTRAAIRVRGISGSIKAATEKYIPQSTLQPDENKRRVDLGPVSGSVARVIGREIDLCPDDRKMTEGSGTRYVGLTSFDLCGEDIDADGTSDGL